MNNKIHSLDFKTLSVQERYKILAGSVVPRPIALVTSINNKGELNTAPFSFFNALSANPPLVGFGIQRMPDGQLKDTYKNIIESREFTVNIVSDSLVEAMNICAIPFESNIDEASMAGLSTVSGTLIHSPRVKESKISLECTLFSNISTGEYGDLLLGEVVMAHISESIIDTDNLYIDQIGLDAVGRMGGQGYIRTREYFDLKAIKKEEFGKVDQLRIWGENLRN
jgi:flavin reductase (DIM6/NTAB) family NADH-FMN oxidoreductase RutF